MDVKMCPSFDGCEATLCPADSSCDAGAEWYPNEPICNAHKMKRLYPWIKTQRRIVKKACDPNRFFTKRMLETIKAVHAGLLGIHPDSRQTEESWIKARLIKASQRPKHKKHTLWLAEKK